MRATNSLICGQTTQGIAVAEIHYENSDDNKPPSTAANFTDPGLCKNASVTVKTIGLKSDLNVGRS